MPTRMLIEDWFPLDVIGAESMRERGASSALPPLYFLHVWWARRPLAMSRAAILASVLPAWNPNWPKELKEKFPTEESYRAWFTEACGVFGNPVKARKLLQWAKSVGKKIPNPYDSSRAFTISPSPETLSTMGLLLDQAWGTRQLDILDPFAGGGSIPFEALRYGFRTHVNEINPVASVILKATLDYPIRFGPGLSKDIRKFGLLLSQRVRERLRPFFSTLDEEHANAEGVAYLWARTVQCPYTGKPLPLVPNWWVEKGTNPVAVRAVFDPGASEARFEIVEGSAACATLKPDAGTVRRGDAVSPWAHNQSVDGDYIKAEAQAGRMGQQLYALAIKKSDGFTFRVPDTQDHRAILHAGAALAGLESRWSASAILPGEEITSASNYDRGHRLYGVGHWRDMFTSRQLLSLCTAVEELRGIEAEIRHDLPHDRADAVMTCLAIVVDGCVARNSKQASWVPLRQVIAPAFVQHGFALKWSFAEFDASRNLLPWVTEQTAEAFERIARLTESTHTPSIGSSGAGDPVGLSKQSAASLPLLSRSIAAVVTDPPYYDNVMYAELSDYFYVWMKRTLGGVYPEWFGDELTNKDDEIVANAARFAALGSKKKPASRADYERKLAAAFREMHRVLRDDGVLTVMFTHKEVAAWDTLATSLIGAGFAIHSSWPILTEYEKGLGMAKKNAAQSTILLTCRKREPRAESVWWDDLKSRVRSTARETAQRFEEQGIRGVDLYIATFGPTLAILSENWPVLTTEVDERTGQPKTLRPEVALDVAREEVIALRKQGLLLGRAVRFDPATDWYLMAWDAFRAAEFPADEARKLALALGLDLEKDIVAGKRLVTKKGSTVVLQEPGARRRRGLVDPDLLSFGARIDAAHTAMLLYQEDGAAACQAFLGRTGLKDDSTFLALLQALLNAIPRTRMKGKFVRREAEILEAMRLAFYNALVVPIEEEPPCVVEELELDLDGTGGNVSDDEMDAEDEEEDA